MSVNIRSNTGTNYSQCCIPGCPSKNSGLNVTALYPFPDQETDLIAYRCWLREVRACKAEVGEAFKHNKDTMICELHFREEDFVVRTQTAERSLRFGTIPFLRNCSTSNSDNDVQVICTQKFSNGNANNKKFSNNLKRRKGAKFENLKKEISQQKSLSHQRLLQEKEHQEEKLRQLLLKEEEHRKLAKKQKVGRGGEGRVEVTKKNYKQDMLNREQQIKELEGYQKQLQEAEIQMKKSKPHYIEETTATNNSNEEENHHLLWKKKKAALQLKLEQQRERLLEIQQQEMVYESNKKRKKPSIVVIGENTGKEELNSSFVTAACGGSNEEPKLTAATLSVISCGKCIKLEEDLKLISKQYLELKKENEKLKQQLIR